MFPMFLGYDTNMCVLVILILYLKSLVLTFFWPNHSLFIQAGDDEEGLGIDYEYTQALSELRIDLSNEE